MLRNRKDLSRSLFDEDNERVHNCSVVDPGSDTSRDLLAKSVPDQECICSGSRSELFGRKICLILQIFFKMVQFVFDYAIIFLENLEIA